MSNIATPCKCRICGKVIGHFSLEWPPPTDNAAMQAANEQFFKRLQQALADHMRQAMQSGVSTSQPREHARVLAESVSIGGNLTMLLIARAFDLPPGARDFFDDTRQAAHNLTRTFRMSDADIDSIAQLATEAIDEETIETGAPVHRIPSRQTEAKVKATFQKVLRDLRDQYEAGAPPMAEPRKEAIIR